jgi:hypothetical protein
MLLRCEWAGYSRPRRVDGGIEMVATASTCSRLPKLCQALDLLDTYQWRYFEVLLTINMLAGGVPGNPQW